MPKTYIGTSGWVYDHWQGKFYPADLNQAKWLEFYANHFKTVELNASFYHLPAFKVFAGWSKRTPKDFLFAVKASRLITHLKRLKNCSAPWQKFIKAASGLGKKLGPILFQLAPGLKANPAVLEDFLKLLAKQYQYVFEFRNKSWFSEKIYEVLKKYKIVLCLADSPNYPRVEIMTGPFVYLRFHGDEVLYGSNYSNEELKNWAKKIKNWQKQGLDVYAYFNNDHQAYAVKNALYLKKLLE